MAGYDFSFEKPELDGNEVRALLETFRSVCRHNGLSFHYRTLQQDGDATIYCTVDGPLPGIQAAHDELGDMALGYIAAVRARDGDDLARRVLFELYSPMMAANEEEVAHISEVVFGLAGYMGSSSRVNPEARDPLIDKGSRSRALSSSQRSALASFDWMFGLWRDRDVLGANAVILFDQSFELFLKSALGVGPRTRVNHPSLLDEAEKHGLLTGRERCRLGLFHNIRNGCQHHGRPVRSCTVDSFAEFGRDLFGRLIKRATSEIDAGGQDD